ncbi:SCO3242 family prenyltransferase [Streptomyces sp. NPDC001356]|uniref:SCO3242 family prenyltransferase n=1 Tax=Streptomyces spinosus TaxID=2872623 RepID=UPI001CED178B|nr:UbiA family prenyltransferase [Streptomyces spinosus]
MIAGAAAAGRHTDRRTLGMAASSVCLYWAGMALNDYADAPLDALERPERPIPRGELRRETALAVATGLTAAGLLLAGGFGRRPGLATAVPLAACVWAYDLLLKDTPAGPAVMSASRGLDVLMGGGAGASGPAAVVALHTYGVTTLSRHEVTGAAPSAPLAALACAAGAVLAVGALAARTPRRSGRAAALASSARYLLGYGRALTAAAADPSAPRIRQAVGAGIVGLLPLQAALTAAAGAPVRAAVVAAAGPLAGRLTKAVPAT